MPEIAINTNMHTVNLVTKAKGLHSGVQRMATLTLTSQDGKFSLQIDPKHFEWIGQDDIILVALTLIKNIAIEPPAAPPILDLKAH